MIDNLENTAAISAELLAQLAANPHSAAVIVQDATGTVRVCAYLNRFQLDDPDTVVLLERAALLAVLEEQARVLTAQLAAAGVLV
jgi:hypothetical protein